MPFKPEKIRPGSEFAATERNIEGLARMVNQLEDKVGGPGTTLTSLVAAIINNTFVTNIIGSSTDDAEEFALMVGGVF